MIGNRPTTNRNIQATVSLCMVLSPGDVVSFEWGDKTIEGLFVRFENRKPIGRLCAMIDIEGRGVQPVPLAKVTKAC